MPRDRLFRALEGELRGAVQEGSDGLPCILPRSADEVATAVRLAAEVGAHLVAPGGDARPGAVPIDLRRMSAVLSVDDTSHVAHVGGGALVPTVELELRRRSLTLGIEGALPEESVSAWLARGAPGARDHADDPVDQLVAGLEAVLPDGRALDIRPAPRRAVGPDLIGAFVGGRGKLGIITGAHLVARARTEAVELAFRFPSVRAAEAARAWVRGGGVRPASTAVVEADGEIALRIRLEGLPAIREASEQLVRRVAKERGGAPIDAGDAPPRKRPPEAPPVSDIVRRLAARLDRAGVLS